MIFRSIICAYVLTAAAIILGHCVLPTVSISASHSGGNLPDNFIGFDSAPDRVGDGSALRVRYLCSRPCWLAVEVVVSTLRKTDLVVFRRKWMDGGAVRGYRIRRVVLRWPPSILYRRDFFNRRVLDATNVTVRAWLDLPGDGREPGTYRGAMLRISKELSLPERLATRTNVCPWWSAQILWQISRYRTHHCPREQDNIDLLSFPLASTGEHFGVVRRFQPFIDRRLERARRHAVTQPSVTLSVWIYLLEWCQENLCGIIHHIDGNNLYDSVLMQLTDAGGIIIQARVTTGVDEAFQTSVELPLRKWIRLDCYIRNSEVQLDTTWDNKTFQHVYQFHNSIHYDDTDGYFAIGGSRYMKGIRGYYGPIKYYRFGTTKVRNPQTTLHQLEETHRECQGVRGWTRAFVRQITAGHWVERAVCTSRFVKLWAHFNKNVSKQTWSWEEQRKYGTLFRFLQREEEDIRAGSRDGKNLGRVLFEQAVKTMFTADQRENKIDYKSADLLRASSCFGNHKASLLLAAVHLSGLGHEADQQLGHAYSLIGAAGDNRFALMHAGHKHAHGIDGFPKDWDVAYGYYSNVGQQSHTDSLRMHEITQHVPEHIYLGNREDLKNRDVLSSDVFEYVKLNAARGDAESQRRLASMLFWGRHGVSKDPAAAVKWYERSAMQMKDPSALYDYSILLMKGQGAKRNYSRGLQLMQKAAAMGSISALNGLGWYHGIILKDHEKAVKYFEQAALNGSADAVFNLGLYQLNGENPKRPERNETAAFHHFLNASRSGHVAASVEAAWYLATGRLEEVSRDAERAVTMLRAVCEQNGHLGFMITEALHAYLEGSWQEALVMYVLAAEAGLGLAQSNVAHLCEGRNTLTQTVFSLSSIFQEQELKLSHDCQRRYLNHSILAPDAHPSSLLKMGDYLYYCRSSSTRGDSLSSLGQAISMYGRAALAGSPQGMFNLAVLVQQGHVLPSSVRRLFEVSRHDERDVVVEKVLKRCAQNEDAAAASPCSVALLGVQMGKALRRMSQNGAQLLLAYAALLSAAVITVVSLAESCLGPEVPRQSAVRPRAQTSSEGQDGVSGDRERGGIMTPTFTTARNQWLSVLDGQRRLRQTGDLAVTLSGVCLCAFWTTLLYHVL